MRFLPAGRRGVLVEVADLDAVVRLAAAVRQRPPAGVVDIVPAARTVLLTHDGTTTSALIAEHLGSLPMPSTRPAAGRPVTIAVSYDGADLAEVSRQSGLTEREVVQAHLAGDYLVAFIGFAPGFAYLAGGPPALRVARRPSPRTSVPAGSVALAGEFTGLYPREGPGGWQLIGHTEAPLWDLARDPAALLLPGTRVGFVAAP